MSDEVEKKLAMRVARALARSISEESAVTLQAPWLQLSEEVRNHHVEMWAETISLILYNAKHPFVPKKEVLLAEAAEELGGWHALFDLVQQQWQKAVGDEGVVPTLGPPHNAVVDCLCHGGAVDCVWCENSGKLTPAVRQFIEQHNLSAEEKGERPGNERERDNSVARERDRQTYIDTFARSFAYEMQQLGATHVRRDANGSIAVDFPRQQEKRRLCPNDSVEMKQQWHCEHCGHHEKSS